MTVAAIQGRKGELWLNTGSATTFTTEACDQKAGTVYHITNTAKRVWDPATAVSVYDNGVLQTTGYHLHAPVGEIHFDGAPTTPVTVSGKYFAVAETTLVQQWDAVLTPELAEVTALGATSREFVGLGIKAWSGSFEHLYEATGPFVTKGLANATKIIMKLYEDQPNTRALVGYGVITSVTPSMPVEDLARETISFTGDGEPFYVTVET